MLTILLLSFSSLPLFLLEDRTLLLYARLPRKYDGPCKKPSVRIRETKQRGTISRPASRGGKHIFPRMRPARNNFSRISR